MWGAAADAATDSRQLEGDEDMTTTPALDHIAISVPDVDEHVGRLAAAFGLDVELHFEGFMAVLADPASGLKLEVSKSPDAEVHFRHFGFRADDVDAAHATLVQAGMESKEAPGRQDHAHMYQSRLQQPGGIEVQLVKYD
jgi:hypothetical protein